jgi:hypothetical protein
MRQWCREQAGLGVKIRRSSHVELRQGGQESSAVVEAAVARDRRFQELVATVVHGPGVLPCEVREALIVGAPAPEGLAALASKVAEGGLAVTDLDVRRLLDSGHSEDAVFECVVAVAVAAGWARLRTVEQLLSMP